jgi:hypothetical protein
MGLRDRIAKAQEERDNIGRCWDGAVDGRRCTLKDGHTGAHRRPWARTLPARDETGALR